MPSKNKISILPSEVSGTKRAARQRNKKQLTIQILYNNRVHIKSTPDSFTSALRFSWYIRNHFLIYIYIIFSLTNNNFERKARLMFSSIHQSCLFLYCIWLAKSKAPHCPTTPLHQSHGALALLAPNNLTLVLRVFVPPLPLYLHHPSHLFNSTPPNLLLVPLHQ